MSVKTYLINSTLAEYTDAELSFILSNLFNAGVFGDPTSGTMGLAVTQQGSPNMTVAVSAGKTLVSLTKNSITWQVIVENTASLNVTISSNSSGINRVDAIIVRVDKDAEPNALKTNVGTIEVVNGSGATALTDGAITTAIGSDGFIRLANITVANGASSIVTANIADTRVKVTNTSAVSLSDNVRDFSFYDAETDQTQTTQNSTYAVGEANATTKKNIIGQKFVSGKAGIRGVKLYKSASTGSFTGTVKVALQADSSGSPAGADLASYTITNAVWLLIATGEFTVQFSAEYATVLGSTYWIVITTSTSDNSNHPNFGINTAGGYSSGALKYYNVTDGWTLTATSMLYFKTLQARLGKKLQTDPDNGLIPVPIRPFSVIDFDVTAVSGTNTTPALVYSKMLDAGIFSLASGIRIKNLYTVGGGNTSGTGTITVKLNGTTIATANLKSISYDSGRGGEMEFVIINNASLSAQRWSIFGSSSGATSGAGNGWTDASSGTSAIDTTAPVFLEIYYTTSASGGNTINVNHISTLVEKIA
jgi:hypothetical protein